MNKYLYLISRKLFRDSVEFLFYFYAYLNVQDLRSSNLKNIQLVIILKLKLNLFPKIFYIYLHAFIFSPGGATWDALFLMVTKQCPQSEAPLTDLHV